MMKPKVFKPIALACLLLCTPSWAGAPIPPSDDNGNVSFARQIVPKLLGRKARGTREVNLLADIAGLHGREAVVRLLMEQPEFTSNWIAILADHLEVQRESGRAQSPACFDAPTPAGFSASTGLGAPGGAGDLAAFVRDEGIDASYGSVFNMYDLIESAIALDNLFPVYRAYLFALGSKPPGSAMRTEAERRAAIGIAFDDVYLHRDMECMSCHRGTYSTTGIGVHTHPLYETLDLVMFDHTGIGEVSIIENEDYQDCAGCHGANGQGGTGPGILGWSADALETVLQNPPPAMAAIDWSALYNDDARMDALAESLNGPFGQAEIENTAAMHYAVFRTDLFEADSDEQPPGWGPWGISTECASIQNSAHQGPIPGFFAGIADDYASMLEVDEDLATGYDKLEASLPDMQAWDDSGTIPGDVGFAYMVAAKITDNVWQTLMGERLTIVNQFARNNLQRDLHKHLTENVFIASDWSLKELIFAILETRFFNRRAPAASLQETPYVLPPIFDPFVPADQECLAGASRGDDDSLVVGDALVNAEPGHEVARIDVFTTGEDCAYNGQGELVHRHSPRVLLSSVGAALDWPAPRIFPSEDYPSMGFSKIVGQYVSDFDEGEKDVNFQSLLNWDGQYGVCSTPANAGSEDWISRVVEAVDAFNDAHPAAPLTLGDVVLTVKDWLLQEPVLGGYERPADPFEPLPPVYGAPGTKETGPALAADIPSEPPEPGPAVFGALLPPEPSEADLVEDLFGFPLSTTVSSETFGDEAKLRELCGVYLKTPQFMLAGIVRPERFEPPRLRVCNGEPCGYRDMCEGYATVLADLGYQTACSFGTVGEPLPFTLLLGDGGGGDAIESFGLRRVESAASRSGVRLKLR